MSTGPVLRAGIVGAGWIGRRHAETIAGRDDIEVAAVCDIDPERAGEVAARSGAQVFEGWQEVLDGAAPDTVWICTPPRAHAAPAIAVLDAGLALYDAGLALYLEKPIARSLADAAEIVAAAARSAAAWTDDDLPGRYLVELTTADAARTLAVAVAAEQALATGRKVRVQT